VEHHAAGVFLAHHQDDLAETMLLHLFRGTGLKGLAGIQPDATIFVDGDAKKPLRMLRPLLSMTREELEQTAARDGIEFRHDGTNDSLEITRNRLRHQLLPLASEILNRDVRQPMAKLARILAEEETFLESLVPDASGAELSVATLTECHPAIRRRLILRWLQGQAVPNITLEVVLAVENLALQVRPAKTNLSTGLHVRRTAGRLWIER
jgi:tRNA(Ile)-lysidine synthase